MSLARRAGARTPAPASPAPPRTPASPLPGTMLHAPRGPPPSADGRPGRFAVPRPARIRAGQPSHPATRAARLPCVYAFMTSGIGYGGTVDIGKISETTGAETETVANGQPARQAEAGPGKQPPGEPAKQAAAPDVGPRDQARLVFASFLMLFVELALIRWVTANNVYVTKATNFVLLASFLGIGIGFLNARGGRDYLRWTPVALLALVGFVLAFPVVLQVGPTPFRGVGHIAALPKPLSFALIFVLTVTVM